MTTRPALPAFLLTLALPAFAGGPWTPPAGVNLVPDEASFAGTISAAGRPSQVTSSMSSREEKGAWVLRELGQSSSGDTLEVTVLDRNTFAVRSRNTQQGATHINLTYAQGKVHGTITAGGIEDAVDADLGGEAFADGACSAMVLAGLPLAAGYHAEFRSYNLRTRKAVIKLVKVEGLETLKVPAGSFRAWKAVVTNADGEPGSTTVWSEEGTHRLVRYEFRMTTGGSELLIVQERIKNLSR